MDFELYSCTSDDIEALADRLLSLAESRWGPPKQPRGKGPMIAYILFQLAAGHTLESIEDCITWAMSEGEA